MTGQEKQTVASGSQGADQGRAPDNSARVAEAVVFLNIARQNLLAYPEGHLRGKEGLESALRHLRGAIPGPAGIQLAAAKEALLYNASPLAPGAPGCREIAAALYHRNIAAVTFLPGLTADELARFLKLLTRKPQEIETAGGLQRYLTREQFRNIVVSPTDYSLLRFAEQGEIFRPAAAGEEGEPVFHALVTSLLAGTPPSPEPRRGAEPRTPHDARLLAHMINTNRLGAHFVLHRYQRTIAGYCKSKQNEAAPTASGEPPLAGIGNFLDALDPINREQFLAATYRFCAESVSESTIAPLVEALGRDLTMEMLLQANEQGEEISPSLLNFVQKIMSSFRGETEPPAGETEPGGQERWSPDAAESFQKLFQREEIEQYVAEDYARVLMQLSDAPLPAVMEERQNFPLAQYLSTLEEPHLSQRLARTLLAMLNDHCPPDKYREAFATLLPVADTLLASGDFLHFANVLARIRHRQQTTDPGERAVAEECFRHFQRPPLLSKILAAVEATLPDPPRPAVTVLYLLGDATVPGLLDFYLKEEARRRATLLAMLQNFPETAIAEARKKLDHATPEQIRPLLDLFRHLGGEKAGQALREIIDHPDRLVGKEAFVTLLGLRDRWAMESLRQFLHADDWETRSGAIGMAGRCRLREFVPDLVAMLAPAGLLRPDLRRNERLIKALGQIGDPAAVPALEKMVSRNFTLFPKDLRRLKKTVFESLERYPPATLANLVNIGERAHDKSIRLACQRVALRTLQQT